MIIKYVNSVNRSIDLTDFNARIKDANFHNYNWSTDVDTLQFGSRINRFTKEPATYDITLLVRGPIIKRKEILNDIFEITDFDVVNKQVGRLHWGDYYIEGYVVSSNTSPSDFGTELTISLYCPYPFWIKETTTQFNITTHGGSGKNLDYPFDYKFDYLTSLNNYEVNNKDYVEDDFVITFYGPITNPQIIIGNHKYKVNCSLVNKELLKIDSRNKTIIKYDKNGVATNMFNKRGKEMYIFEKIPTGISGVSWVEDFRFDITLIERRSEPKWT